MNPGKADEVIDGLFESILKRYQIGLETSMEVVILSLIALTCCSINAMKYILTEVDHI